MDARAINRMLELRVKDLAARTPARGREEHRERATLDRDRLLKALGLYPLPPRTELKAQVTGELKRDGYRIEKVRFESRPGLLVTAHLYLPEGTGPFPVVLVPHGHFEHKKSTPVVQAGGISLALQGFAAMIVDSPGHSWDVNDVNERREMGTHDDRFLCMGTPVQGVYVWDLMRALDYLEGRGDISAKRVGITGSSGGGTATMLAFAADERIQAAVPVCAVSSMEDMPHNGCLCNHVPGLMDLGDRADVLALRAPAPVMIIGASDDPEFPAEGMKRTHEKMRGIYRQFREESKVRLEIVEGIHDYSRRMREAMLAFFREHLLGERTRTFVPEARPLTDGVQVPYEANTEPASSRDLLVTSPEARTTRSFRSLLHDALDQPYPEAFDRERRLVRWGQYGRVGEGKVSSVLRLSDAAKPEVPDVTALPHADVDQRLCFYLGLSVPEVFAQMLHLLLPGGPEGWESVAHSGDALTSMIATMKNLVGSANPVDPPKSVVADGPVASMTARFLKLYRPELELQASHAWTSWSDVLQSDVAALAQPQARYLAWPFGYG